MSQFQIPNGLLGHDPYLHTPGGPEWLIAGEDAGLGHGSFLVRRLASAHSMLRVGAVLGNAARIELPNLKPVSHWTKTAEGVWIATPLEAELRPLSARKERLDWVAAIEAWRPLVAAVQRAHRAGVVHGSLTPWTTWEDSVTGRWVATGGGTWAGDGPGSGVWSPWKDRDQPQSPDDVANLARLLVQATLGAEEGEQARPNLQGLPAYAIPVLDRALRGEVGSTVDLLSALSPSSISRHVEEPDGESTTLLYGRVHGVEEVNHPRMGEGVKFWITR